jgi:hypothetical protein
MPKKVLVICSDNSGRDFPRDENQTMLKQLLGDDFVAQFMDRYPKDLPTEENEFDAVLFAGCNVISWLFKFDYEDGMKKLARIIKKDGIVIFVENQNYINKMTTIGKSYSLSIPLEEMTIHPTIKDDKTGLKQEIVKSWEKFFELEIIDNYFVYKVKGKQGGKRKSLRKKRKSLRKKRKTAYKERKTMNKRKRTHKRI